MKRPIALLMLALLFAAHASCGKKEYKFVTADSLVCRQEPRVGAPIVTVLPYGTRVEISRGDREDVIAKQKGKWLYSEALGGYLFSAFIADARPAEGRFTTTLILGGTRLDTWRELYCALPGIGASETAEKLMLTGNRAVRERVKRAEGVMVKTIDTGVYEAEGPRVEIKFTVREQTEVTGPRFTPKLTRSTINESETLHYSEKATGFVTKEVLATLSDAAWRLDYNACTVVKKLLEKCEADIVKKVEKGEIPYTDEKNRKALIRGYYCTRIQ
jgi:hypothetical protein